MLEKSYTGENCLVTFRLPKEIQAEDVTLVGDFNDWDEKTTPMLRQEDGSFLVTLELKRGKNYQFRYLINGSEWHNDWSADCYLPNPFSGDNSVVIV